MGVTRPREKRSGIYFGCGGAACLGLVFWAIIACCLLLIVLGLSTELDSGDAELISAFYALSQILVGSLAFCYSMVAIIVVFGSFGLYRRTKKYFLSTEPYALNEVLLYFFLFVGGMLLAAGVPTLALEYPNSVTWMKIAGVLLGFAYLLYGMLMLWLTLVAYDSYRHADEGA